MTGNAPSRTLTDCSGRPCQVCDDDGFDTDPRAASLTVERFLERHELLNQIRYVLSRRRFPSHTARARAFWHYIVRRYPWEICGDCGRPAARGVHSWWHADNDLWARINGSEYGVLCPACFTDRADAMGVRICWKPVLDA